MTAIPQGRTRRAALATAACALAATGAMALTGCNEDPDAGTNGVGKLSADRIQAKTRAAAQAAPAVRLSGTVVTSGRTYTLDMRLKAEGGTGSVTSQGATFRLLRVGKQLYLKADADFWNHADGSDGAAGKLDGKYVKVPQGDPAYKKFSGFTDKDVLLGGLLTLHGKLAADGHHEESGTRTIRITGDAGSGGTLDVSLEGKPYPLSLVRGGSAGTLRFSDWGKDFAVTDPATSETVDYGKQLPTS
ncbi:hypothetical protein J2Z21_002085 [Streptomyces griseochromogenes]|uniref:Lipoprotein n=1 Tax=Streptomyces griseochromogenes TaxID=68214 RepID=A0A1B1ART6_9ACTN|nr:hypothetical protein [Streptomyces griseochromogenes]ANP49289.1 hypothetical protein AVL59_06505 [Streptomyces griseochromogenes]MBP2049154.1 hypothetical protein [Streptomyces griseochromogenes]